MNYDPQTTSSKHQASATIVFYNKPIQEKYMSTKDTLELFKQLLEMIKMNKQYAELLEKRIALLEKSNG